MALDTNLIVIGFDAEWVRIPDTNDNKVLSYQYYGKTLEGEWSGIIEPKGPSKSDRLKLIQFVGKAIEAGRDAGVLPYKWPDTVYLTGHFTRADLPTFSDFSKLKNKFDSLRKTYVTLTRPYKDTYVDSARNRHPLTIYLSDTMLTSPGGSSLESLGALHGVPKIELPEGAIEHMDKLKAEDPGLFELYAIRDAEISAKHTWYMAEFNNQYLDGKAPPTTLGNLAVAHFLNLLSGEGIDLTELLGQEEIKETEWNSSTNRPRTTKKNTLLDVAHRYEILATEAYHGGRNEAYEFGFTEGGEWYDVDLAGAYTTAMVAIQMPDWENLRHTSNVDDFKIDELGLANFKFKFPEETRYPCLPVRTDNGLIFPLEGKTNAGSPEIVLALNMGAEITHVDGVVVPWASSQRPFQTFSSDILKRRSEKPKGSPEERTWKEIGNSLYGKLAQGLKEKRAFDSREGGSALLPPSKVTQPYLAAYVTSIIRAVLGELLHSIPDNHRAVSATTDGFISDLDLDDLDTSGPLCSFFSDLRSRLSSDASVLETKHVAELVLCWKTRGQVDAKPDPFASTEDNGEPIIAKAGLKLRDDLAEIAINSFDPYSHVINDENWMYEDHVIDYLGDSFYDPPGLEAAANTDSMVDLFLNREAGQKIKTSALISMREMFADDADMVSIEGEQTLNMEYDWKRELIDPFDRDHGQLSLYTDYPYPETHLYAHSRPWKTVEDFNRARALFDEWRLKRGGVLKTMEDWKDWQEYLQTDNLSKKGVRRSNGGPVDQLRRIFLQAYALGECGLPGGDYKGLANYLTEAGHETTVDDLKNAKRRKNPLLRNEVSRTDEVMEFIDVVLKRYPEFEWEELVG